MTTLTKALREMLEFDKAGALRDGAWHFSKAGSVPFAVGGQCENARLKPLHDALIEMVEALESIACESRPNLETESYWKECARPDAMIATLINDTKLARDALTKLKAAVGVKETKE